MQKNQYKDKYLVSPDKKEYEGLSLNYKNIFISLEIQNLQIDPLIIYKLLKSENCFYMQKTLPGNSTPFETIMGLKSTKIEEINGTDPIKKLRKIIEKNKSTTYCNSIYDHNGLFSYFSYECFQYFDKVPKLKKDPNGCPECLIATPELISSYDHLNHKLIISKKIKTSLSNNYEKQRNDLIEIANCISQLPEKQNINSLKEIHGSKTSEVIHKKDGRLHIYVRQDKYKGELKSKNWVGRLYIDGKQKISSSGTPNLEEAIPILEKWFDDVHAQKEKDQKELEQKSLEATNKQIPTDNSEKVSAETIPTETMSSVKDEVPLQEKVNQEIIEKKPIATISNLSDSWTFCSHQGRRNTCNFKGLADIKYQASNKSSDNFLA